MSGNTPLIYWDACVFLHYLGNVEAWMPTLVPLLDAARDGKIIIHTSVVTQVEVAFTAQEKANTALDAGELARLDALWRRRGIKIVEFNPFVAITARNILRDDMEKNRERTGINTADYIHLATALYMQVDEMHTTEKALHRYTEILGKFPVQNPTTPMQRLQGV